MRRNLPSILAASLLTVVTFAVYARACGNGFVNFDDDAYVAGNRQVQEGLTWPNVGWAFTTTACANWHPLTWLSLELDTSLFGTAAWGYHLTSVLLHVVNTLLLFFFLHAATGSVWRSAAVAGLFAWHPLHVESVAWVSERKDVLSAFFGLLALLAYVAYARRPGLGRYLLVALALALGLLSKPMLVTLPLVLLLLDWWPLRRLKAAPPGDVPGPPPGRPASLGWLCLEKLPLLLLSAASCAVTVYAQQHGHAVRDTEELPPGIRLGNAVLAYGTYLVKTFWPAGLSAFYPHPWHALPWDRVALAGVVLVAVTALVVRFGRRLPYLPVGWLWFVGTLVPVIGIVQVGKQAGADRYTYVPLIGLFWLAVWGVADLARRWRSLPAAAGLAVVVLLACAFLTWRQVGYWRDSITLWEHALRLGPNNSVAHNNLGRALEREDRPAEAVEHYAAAVQLDPANAAAHVNLGGVLRREGRTREAIRHFTEALRLEPDSGLPHYNLGVVLEGQGQLARAERHYREAVRLGPEAAAPHNNLGALLRKRGRLREAAEQFREAVAADPHYALGYYNLGAVLKQQGNQKEAVACFRQAVACDPDSAKYRSWLASGLNAQGQTTAAAAEYEAVLRRYPDWPASTDRTAWALATDPEPGRRDGALAAELAEQVCQATGERQVKYLDTLAAAYAEAGRFKQAVAKAATALKLAAPEQRDEIAARLRLYEAGRPYHRQAAPAPAQ